MNDLLIVQTYINDFLIIIFIIVAIAIAVAVAVAIITEDMCIWNTLTGWDPRCLT